MKCEQVIKQISGSPINAPIRRQCTFKASKEVNGVNYCAKHADQAKKKVSNG